MEQNTSYKTKKLGKKTYIYDTRLPALAEKVAEEHSLDIKNVKVEFALVDPMISKYTAGRCLLVHNEYTLLTETNFMITFSNKLWEKLLPEQRELLMCHELMHIARVKDKLGNFKHFALARHTIEDFRYLIQKYGVNWLEYVKTSQEVMDGIERDKSEKKLAAKEAKKKTKKDKENKEEK